MNRFVLLEHALPAGAARGTHWDFMLEAGGVLRTWALDGLPVAQETVAALQLADHRLDYLEYEGPVSGNRGSVKRIDCGEYVVLAESSEQLEIALLGELLRGRATLSTTSEHQRWRFAFRTNADLGTSSAP